MEELVRDEGKKSAVLAVSCSGIWRRRSCSITTRGFKAEPRIAERGRVQALQTAAGICTQVEKESVVLVGNLAAHYFYFGFHNLLNIASHSFCVIVALAVNYDSMRNTLDVEDDRFEIACFERGVVKYVEVLCTKRVLRSGRDRKSTGYFPNIRSEDLDC